LRELSRTARRLRSVELFAGEVMPMLRAMAPAPIKA
jgi:hypothetical protein